MKLSLRRLWWKYKRKCVRLLWAERRAHRKIARLTYPVMDSGVASCPHCGGSGLLDARLVVTRPFHFRILNILWRWGVLDTDGLWPWWKVLLSLRPLPTNRGAIIARERLRARNIQKAGYQQGVEDMKEKYKALAELDRAITRRF